MEIEHRQILVIHGSARKESDTNCFIEKVFQYGDYNIVHLAEHFVAPYNYEHHYPQEDCFYTITEKVLAHRIIVWATPVYWYAMSGLLKTFFDRITDLVTINKTIGRQWAGKKTLLLSVGADAALPPGFEVPFHLTAQYLNMQYDGCLYHSTKHAIDKEAQELQLLSFTSKLKS